MVDAVIIQEQIGVIGGNYRTIVNNGVSKMIRNIILLLLFLPVGIKAQVMDDNSIKKLQSGEYTLEQGKIQVTFSDTVHPEFVTDQLESLGYEILSSNFQNIILSIENDPEPAQLKEIENTKWVDFIMTESADVKDEKIDEIANEDSLKDGKVNRMLAQLNYSTKYEYILVALNFAATNETVESLKAAFPDLVFLYKEQSERSAILKTAPDKEMEAMDELKKLPYVNNTALIGILD